MYCLLSLDCSRFECRFDLNSISFNVLSIENNIDVMFSGYGFVYVRLNVCKNKI